MSALTWEDVLKVVTNDWLDTREIATRAGVPPVYGDIGPTRHLLHVLLHHGYVDLDSTPGSAGHRWRRSEAAEREDEPPRQPNTNQGEPEVQ